jgi:hypothetical protein
VPSDPATTAAKVKNRILLVERQIASLRNVADGLCAQGSTVQEPLNVCRTRDKKSQVSGWNGEAVWWTVQSKPKVGNRYDRIRAH